MEGGGAATYDVYFAPEDAAALDGLFAAMTACAELHPDPAEEEEGEEGGEGMMMGGGGYAWAEALMAQAEAEGAGEQEGAGSAAAVPGQFEPPEGEEGK